MANLKAGESLVLVFSFLVGLIRYSVICTMFNLISDDLQVSYQNAVVFFHLSMALIFLVETLAGTLTKTRLGLKNTAALLSGFLFLTYSTVYILDYYMNMLLNLYVFIPVFLCICAEVGGVVHCQKQLILNEYDLPHEKEKYTKMAFWYIEMEYLGQLCGGFVSTGFYLPGLNPDILVLEQLWVASSLLLLAVTLVGLKLCKKQRDNRNVISEFVAHSCYAFRDQLTNKNTETEEFTSDDLERLKIVYSILPIYLPVVLLVGLRDLRYSRYVWQSYQQSSLVVSGYRFGSIKILLLYPLFISVCMPVYVFVFNPLLKKYAQQWKTTTRAIVAFYLFGFSLACATVLECRLQRDQIFQSNKTISNIAVFNFLPCQVTLNATCTPSKPYNVNHISVIDIQCPVYEEFQQIWLQGACSLNNRKTLIHMLIAVWKKNKWSYAALAFKLPLPIMELDKIPIVFEGIDWKYDERNTDLMVVYQVVDKHVINIVPMIFRGNKWVKNPVALGRINMGISLLPDPYVQTSLIYGVEIGRYHYFLDGVEKGQVSLRSGEKYAIMISQIILTEEAKLKVVRIQKQERKLSILYQLPQVIFSLLGEVLIKAPGFFYALRKVPIQWHDFLGTLWVFCCFLGNIIIVVTNVIANFNGNLSAFSVASALSVIAISLITIFLLDYYKADYEEDAK